MGVRIHSSWKNVLQHSFNAPYFAQLTAFVRQEYKQVRCYPPAASIFAAFDHCPFDKVRVVLIGQDPYHGPGQAHGLSFSVPEGVAHPPSLVNIFKELQTDIGIAYPKSGDLSHWAKQGVLLLNATLTVRAHQAGSHQGKGWEQFTQEVITCLSAQKQHLVFLLWGGFAKRKQQLIDPSKHCILTAGHPSPLSANRGYWFGNQHFSKCNAYLNGKGLKSIAW